MAVGAGHLLVIGLHAGGANGVGKVAHGLGRKEPVGADADKAEAGANPAKGFGCRGASSLRVPDVHGAQNGQIGVGVKAVDEALSLVVEVAGDVKAPSNEA